MNTIHIIDEATGFIPAPNDKGTPITVIGNDAIRETFDAACLQQAVNSRGAPGISRVVLNPSAHVATNIDTIGHFLPVSFAQTKKRPGLWEVAVKTS